MDCAGTVENALTLAASNITESIETRLFNIRPNGFENIQTRKLNTLKPTTKNTSNNLEKRGAFGGATTKTRPQNITRGNLKTIPRRFETEAADTFRKTEKRLMPLAASGTKRIVKNEQSTVSNTETAIANNDPSSIANGRRQTQIKFTKTLDEGALEK
jgi:hypothetical protein